MESVDSFVMIWRERKGCLGHREQIEIDSKLKTYNRTRIHSTYKAAQTYRSNLPNLYVIQGDIPNAG
jgi:hypothetical protein